MAQFTAYKRWCMKKGLKPNDPDNLKAFVQMLNKSK